MHNVLKSQNGLVNTDVPQVITSCTGLCSKKLDCKNKNKKIALEFETVDWVMSMMIRSSVQHDRAHLVLISTYN